MPDIPLEGRTGIAAMADAVESCRQHAGQEERRLATVVAGAQLDVAALAGAGGTVTSTGSDELVVAGLDPERIAGLLSERGLPLHELYRERPTLEDVFIDLTSDSLEYVAERFAEVDGAVQFDD